MVTAIGFSGGFRPGQLVIQAATCDPAAHCFAVLSGGTIIDATFARGVKERKISEVDATWCKIIPTDSILTLTQAMRLEIWLKDQLGKFYDMGFIVGYPWSRHWQAETEWVCSELIGAGLVAVGALEIPRMHRLTPRNLRRRLEELR